MSRIGNKPVVVAAGVEIEVKDGVFTAKGQKGSLSVPFDAEFVDATIADGVLTVVRKKESKEARARHGLYRSLFANAIEGVSAGFVKSIEINGVGYRAAIKGQSIELSLGYSHPINYDFPEGVTIAVDADKNNIFHISGIDKQQVGQTAAEIRSFRKPEPYKGKGIKYLDEHIARKAGKSAAK